MFEDNFITALKFLSEARAFQTLIPLINENEPSVSENLVILLLEKMLQAALKAKTSVKVPISDTEIGQVKIVLGYLPTLKYDIDEDPRPSHLEDWEDYESEPSVTITW